VKGAEIKMPAKKVARSGERGGIGVEEALGKWDGTSFEKAPYWTKDPVGYCGFFVTRTAQNR
jgi:hypothetical protein